MSDQATGGASAGESQGGSSEAGSVPAVPAGYVPQSQLDQLEQRRRDLQATADRERSQREALERRIAELQGSQSAPAGGDSVLTAEAIGAQVEARIARYHAMQDAKAQAREQFKFAPATVLDGSYDSPEALLAAAQSAHEAVDAQRTQMRTEIESELFGRIKEQHGIDLTPAPQTTQTPEGDQSAALTPARLASMSQAEFNSLDPAVVRKVLHGTP